MKAVVASALVTLTLFLSPVTGHSAPPESNLVAQARELVDTYYGNRGNLSRAAVLLEQAHKQNPQDSAVYVQAARITIKGAALSFGNLEAGGLERYEALLDKAIALDQNNAKAHLLKSEVYRSRKQYKEQLAEVEVAKKLDPQDPWIDLELGEHYRLTKRISESVAAYSRVERRGPGAAASERKAYVSALSSLMRLYADNEVVKELAAKAVKERYPTDAWTPQGCAETLIDLGLFDDAVPYAREALKTMDFGAGRMTLAAALYAKATKLGMAGGSDAEVKKLADEAGKFHFAKGDIYTYLIDRRAAGDVKGFEPALRATLDKWPTAPSSPPGQRQPAGTSGRGA